MRSAWRRVVYRVAQTLRGFAALSPEEASAVRARLSRSELALFVAMDQHDRRHSVDLLQWLQSSAAERGVALPVELEAAALLHDVGKGRLHVWERGLYVVLNAATPALARWLESPGDGLRGALWRLRHHAELGAAVLEGVGASARVVELVRRHLDRPGADADLAWLIEGDSAT